MKDVETWIKDNKPPRTLAKIVYSSVLAGKKIFRVRKILERALWDLIWSGAFADIINLSWIAKKMIFGVKKY